MVMSHDSVTKNVRDVGARSKHCDSEKNIGAGSEKGRSNVTVTKNIGAGRIRI